MKHAPAAILVFLGLLIFGLWIWSSIEDPIEKINLPERETTSTPESVNPSEQIIRSVADPKEPPLVDQAQSLEPVEASDERLGNLVGYVAPGWDESWRVKAKVRLFNIPEEAGEKPMAVLSQEVSIDSAYQMFAPVGDYLPGIRIGSSTFFGEVIQISEDKLAVCDFYPSKGNRVFGAFQLEFSPENSTFMLEVFRDSDMKLISLHQLTGNPNWNPLPMPEEEKRKGNVDKNKTHGYFSVENLLPGDYVLRFSLRAGPSTGFEWFTWDHQVTLKSKDFDFGTKYADFSKYAEFLTSKPPQ